MLLNDEYPAEDEEDADGGRRYEEAGEMGGRRQEAAYQADVEAEEEAEEEDKDDVEQPINEEDKCADRIQALLRIIHLMRMRRMLLDPGS